MALVHTFHIRCDSCGKGSLRFYAELEAKNQAMSEGWVRTVKHGDQCPDCRESNPIRSEVK